MREVVDGVFEVRFGYVHAHLVVVDDGVVLVDTGLPGKSARFGQALATLKRRIGEVHTILLTHQHPDHTGGVAELQRRSGARVVAHTLDVPVIDGTVPAPKDNLLQKIAGRIMGEAEPVPVDEVLAADGPLSIAGFQAVHTPGHTAGHVSYLLDRGAGVLFAGDAANGRKTKVSPPPGLVTSDPAAARQSIARLAGLEFDTAVFGHGAAVTGRAVEKFKALVAG